MKLLLLVNESASSVTARARVVIHKSLAADHDVTIAETTRRGHAARLAQGAVSKGIDVVVVLGGDGTVNETANGLAGTATALGVLPGGSTNVFARTIGMTNDPIEATGELLSALSKPGGGIERVGLGNAAGRRFLFHCGIGFDAAVVEAVERRSNLKRYLGHTFFAYSALRTWATGYDRHHPHFSVSVRDAFGMETVEDGGFFAIVLNTSPYTYLGDRAFDLVPEVGLGTPLGVVTLRSISVPVLAMVASRTLRRSDDPSPRAKPGGKLFRNPSTGSVSKNVVSVTVQAGASGTFPYQLDGEPMTEVQRLDLSWEPDALGLVVPALRGARCLQVKKGTSEP